MPSTKDQFPLRLIIGQEDCTFLLDAGATFSNVDPGGFEAASFRIPKDMPQTLRGSYVRIDSGLKVAWEGRVSQVQRSLGNKTQIQCEGYGALLKDTATAMVFVDRDLTHWQPASVQRRLNVVASNSLVDPSVVPDATTGAPSLAEELGAAGSVITNGLVEAYYDAGPGNVIGSVYYAWNKASSVNAADGNWSWDVLASTDDLTSTVNSSGNLRAAGPGTGTLVTTGGNKRFAVARFYYAGSLGADYGLYWTCLAVYGNHGLTKRGSNSATSAQGFYTSDIAKYAASQANNLAIGIVPDASNYIIPHYAQRTAVTLDQIVSDMAVAGGLHWGVWEAPNPLTGSQTPRFDFRPRATAGSFTGFCRRGDCDDCDIREDLASLYDTAVVSFTDVTGRPGQVTVTIANPLLAQAGLSGRTVQFQAGTMDVSTATVFGQIALQLLLVQARVAGSVMVSGPLDSQAGPMPAWLLKSGLDRLRVADLPSTDAFGAMNDVPLSRVEASVSESGITTTLEVGTGASLVETLQSRLSSAAVLAAQGGV